MAIRDKETGHEIDLWELVDKEMGSERLAVMVGRLLQLLHDKGVLSEQDAVDLTYAHRWAEVAPAYSLQDSEV
jgi:hypothetical protein